MCIGISYIYTCNHGFAYPVASCTARRQCQAVSPRQGQPDPANGQAAYRRGLYVEVSTKQGPYIGTQISRIPYGSSPKQDPQCLWIFGPWDGHRILYRDHSMAPTKAIKARCPLSLPETFGVAHVAVYCFCTLGILLVGGLRIRALLFGVCIGAPTIWG